MKGSPTDEELARHSRNYLDIETVQNLKTRLIKLLDTNSNKWIRNGYWKVTREAHRTTYKKWMEMARVVERRGDESMSVEKTDKLWSWDAR